LCAPPDNQTWETCHDARPLAVARGCFEAFVSKDRAAIEELFSENNHFTSPIDNALDRNIYLARCWPNSHAVTGFSFVYQVETALSLSMWRAPPPPHDRRKVGSIEAVVDRGEMGPKTIEQWKVHPIDVAVHDIEVFGRIR